MIPSLSNQAPDASFSDSKARSGVLLRPAGLFMKAVAVLLLLVIGIHAAPLATMPIEKVHGSAFSAHTAEVSLAAREDARSERRVVVHPQPLPLLPLASPIVRAEILAVGQTLAAACDRGSVLPSRRGLGVEACPRAPPRA